MLDAYDQAKEKAKSHEVETYQGKVAEAEFRKWLSDFLPKRYSVTTGYIIPQGFSSKEKAPHFDVIIYDALNSPVLWRIRELLLTIGFAHIKVRGNILRGA